MIARLKSCLCTQEQLEAEPFQRWGERLRPAWDHDGSGKPMPLHRKLWEWCYAAQALSERGMLEPGRRGLGFGVGREPLSALFASFGCEIVATDMAPASAQTAGWVETRQHAPDLAALNPYGFCPAEAFFRQVSFQAVDMNRIPEGLKGFDFCWSSCAFEHLGSINLGLRFILEQMACLKPGGFAVHTTEFNVHSNRETIDHTATVLFRRRDIEELVRELSAEGHQVELCLDRGTGPADRHVDAPPFSPVHLKIELERFVTTSLGLIIQKSPDPRQRPLTRAVRKLLVWPTLGSTRPLRP